jgi:hypothetical protein
MTDPLQQMLLTQVMLKARRCSSLALYNDSSAALSPRAVKLGPTRNGWPEFDLGAEQQVRIADRGAGMAKFREGT